MGGSGNGMVSGGEGDAPWAWRGGVAMLGEGDVGVPVRCVGGGGEGESPGWQLDKAGRWLTREEPG